ncbi:MAG: hypothetical protein GXP42_19265 [Chloroflexi bacterium]|nr:hypothetical protein [Chloroflexota bacterium]
MTTLSVTENNQQAIARIDAIIRELEMLRRQLASSSNMKPHRVSGVVEELFGAAGQGERNEYDLDLVWARFGE